jgi:hypothetical protein
MQPKFAYSVLVKINNHSIPEDDEFGAEFDMTIEFCQQIMHEKTHNYMDMFACDYDNVRFDTVDHWLDDLAKVKSGFYELRYNYSMESESWEMPHIQYPVYEDFELVPSQKARFQYYYRKYLLDPFYSLYYRFVGRIIDEGY